MKPRKTKPTSAMEIANIAGVSLTLVHRKLSQGRTARQIIAEAVEQERRVAQRNPKIEVADPNGLDGLNGHAGAVLSFSAAQAVKENWLAELRKLEVMRERGELVPLAYIKQWAVTFLVEARDLWLRGPSELADRLASESDPIQCEAIVRAFCEQVVDRLYKLERLWGGAEDDAA